jgi:hypothetical protein
MSRRHCISFLIFESVEKDLNYLLESSDMILRVRLCIECAGLFYMFLLFFLDIFSATYMEYIKRFLSPFGIEDIVYAYPRT